MLKYILLTAVFILPSALHAVVLNDPYSQVSSTEKIYYTSFAEQPKTLDPATSYNANEYQFIGQIYEPVLQYDYLVRPYQLIPATASQMPEVKRYDKNGQLITSAEENASTSVYTIHIKSGIYYQPHPALSGHYSPLSSSYFQQHSVNQLSDFKHTGTRELVAEDYIYQIKRLASPRVNSSIYGLMSEHIVGFQEYAAQLPDKNQHPGFLDLRDYNLSGVRLIDRYTYEITLKGEYSQFMYWLAMPFFSPIPWEADRFYSQKGMAEKNLSFGWYPVGTGAFMLTENNPNSRMVLVKNPNFRAEYFPRNGSEEDRKKGYLAHAGERIPMIDKVIFVLEKEAIPRWNKFLQGYYDLSGIAADNFDQAIAVNAAGEMILTPQMREKGITLQEVAEPAVYYMGFNMLDDVVGGKSERARKLRQAISIAVNYDENISIFFNGRGSPAQGPIPAGIFGYQEGEKGINPYVYTWENNQRQRRSLDEARALMKAAGYPGGRNVKTKRVLTLHYDVPSTGRPDEKAELNWMMKQFASIGIQLDVRATQYNRFQEKMRSGNAQLFSWGWSADYPDPENFLFLFKSANGKVKFGGENVANYSNRKYDALFEEMKNRPSDAKRLAIINQMVEIIRHDAPWVGGVNTKIPVLRQQWMSPIKPNSVSQNGLKYVAIDVPLRETLRQKWNQATLWPIGVLLILLILFLLPFLLVYKLKQGLPVRRMRHSL